MDTYGPSSIVTITRMAYHWKGEGGGESCCSQFLLIIIFLVRFSLQKDKNKNGNNKTWGGKKSLSQSRKFIIFGFVVLSLVFFLSSFLFYIGE